jgi:guanylate kinase
LTLESPPQPGLLLVISGPAGVGKTTIARRVEKAVDAVFSVSVTTRPRTAQDKPGVDYHFVTREQFDGMVARNELLEHAEVFGNCYGTPRAPVEQAIAAGKTMLLEIDVAGAVQVRQNFGRDGSFGLFVEPPDEAELLRRLRGRGRDDEATIERRFQKAKHEIARAHSCGAYDAFIMNDELDHAVEQAIELVRHELERRAGGI